MVIGVTGSFGSGKTTVAGMFAKKGAYVVDADKICHLLITPSTELHRRIIGHFGRGILSASGKIDRNKLARLVFENRARLKALNSILHPEVITEINRIIKDERKKSKIIIVDAALLVESGFYRKMDKLIVVKNNEDKQIKRLVRAKHMTGAQVLQRIRTQAGFKKKLALADFIIDNSGSRKKTLLQVEKIWKTIRS